ncbi:MAG: fructose-bisphosphatase class II, partial [Candidatus Promineifilaceae bacterium]|nr:fructose-bisphosphatase class II [Candidatus Promineifilaceae bacterium]
VSEGVIAACAVKALGGAMLGRLAPQSEEERRALLDAGFEPDRILSCEELVAADEIFFAATGITESPLLKPIRYRGNRVQTHSLLLRAETGTRRFIQTEHVLAA